MNQALGRVVLQATAGLASLLLSTGCEPKNPDSEPAEPKALPPAIVTPWDDPAFRYVGGWTREPDGLLAAWTGAAVEFQAPPGIVEADLSDDSGRTLGSANYLTILIDDEWIDRIPLRPGRMRYEIAVLSESARITLFKSTEPFVGAWIFHGVATAAPIGAPAEKEGRLLFIGNSITAGFGNLATNGRERYHPSSQDGAQAYGALAARNLGLDYEARAWSGRGVSRNSDGSVENTMPMLWWRTVPVLEESLGPALEQDPPSVVLINLGTNDLAEGRPPEDAFVQEYLEMIERIRREYGAQVPIVLLIGSMLQDERRPGRDASDLAIARQWHEEIVERRREAGDDRVSLLQFEPQTEADGYGAQYHPSIRTHERMADRLTRYLRDQPWWSEVIGR